MYKLTPTILERISLTVAAVGGVLVVIGIIGWIL